MEFYCIFWYMIYHLKANLMLIIFSFGTMVWKWIFRLLMATEATCSDRCQICEKGQKDTICSSKVHTIIFWLTISYIYAHFVLEKRWDLRRKTFKDVKNVPARNCSSAVRQWAIIFRNEFSRWSFERLDIDDELLEFIALNEKLLNDPTRFLSPN